MAVQIQFRRGSSTQWSAVNPVLAQGEAGYELDGNRLKFGNGVSSWNQLSYFGGAGGGGPSLSAGTQSAGTGTVVFSNSNGISFGMSGSSRITASYTSPTHASQMLMSSLSSPTVNQMQEVHDVANSAGWVDGGAVTDAGGGSVNVAVGEGFIRATASDIGTLLTFSWPAPAALAIPNNSIRYVVAEYNGGTPRVILYSSETYDYRTAFPLAVVVNEAGTLYINDTPHAAGRVAGRMGRRNYEVEGRSRAHQLGGLILTETGTRNVAVSSGVTWFRGVRDTFAGLDTSASGSFTRYYRDGVGGWTIEATQTQTPNDNWDNGSGTLQALGTNDFGTRWFYLGPAGGIAMVYGRANHNTLAQAEGEAVPDSLPLRLQVGSILLGRMIYKKSGSSAASVTSAFETVFVGSQLSEVIRGIAVAGSTATSGTVIYSNLNGISFGLNGQTLSASHNALTSQSNQAMSAGGGSSAFQTLVFRDTNGVSFSNSLGSVQATVRTDYASSSHSHGNPTLALTNLAGTTASNSNGLTLSLSATAQTVQTVGLYAVSNTTQSSSGTQDARSLTFAGAGIASVGVTNGSVVISVPAGGGGDGFNILAAGTQTAATNTTIAFVNSNGVTFGMSGSSQITASVAAAGGGATLSYYNPQDAYLQVVGQQGNGTLHVQPAQFPNVAMDRLCFPIVFSGSSNSTGTGTLSISWGLYTRNVSTLSLSTSGSVSVTIDHSGNVNTGLYSGIRLVTVGHTATITEGQYWMGIWSRTSTSSNNMTLSQILASQLASNFSGHFGVATNASEQYTRGLGIYSVSFSTAMPASIAFSLLRGTGSLALRQPIFYAVSGTV